MADKMAEEVEVAAAELAAWESKMEEESSRTALPRGNGAPDLKGEGEWPTQEGIALNHKPMLLKDTEPL